MSVTTVICVEAMRRSDDYSVPLFRFFQRVYIMLVRGAFVPVDPFGGGHFAVKNKKGALVGLIWLVVMV